MSPLAHGRSRGKPQHCFCFERCPLQIYVLSFLVTLLLVARQLPCSLNQSSTALVRTDVVDIAWSPTDPACFASSGMDGHVVVWRAGGMFTAQFADGYSAIPALRMAPCGSPIQSWSKLHKCSGGGECSSWLPSKRSRLRPCGQVPRDCSMAFRATLPYICTSVHRVPLILIKHEGTLMRGMAYIR